MGLKDLVTQSWFLYLFMIILIINVNHKIVKSYFSAFISYKILIST